MGVEELLLVAARVMIASVFVFAGWRHRKLIAPLTQAIAAKGIPFAHPMLLFAVVSQFLGGATLALGYQSTVMPSFFWFYVGRMRRPVHYPAPAGRRVAMITLCVPSHESMDIIGRQLRALKAVRYPHDSWVLDEGASPEIELLALSLGVKYFTRKGIERYNQVTIGRVSDLAVIGYAADDVSCLIAALLDNATKYSPGAVTINVHLADAGDVRAIALSLDGVVEIDSDGFDFRVGGKGFCWSYPDRVPGQGRVIRSDI